jgi:hypothetical protein
MSTFDDLDELAYNLRQVRNACKLFSMRKSNPATYDETLAMVCMLNWKVIPSDVRKIPLETWLDLLKHCCGYQWLLRHTEQMEIAHHECWSNLKSLGSILPRWRLWKNSLSALSQHADPLDVSYAAQRIDDVSHTVTYVTSFFDKVLGLFREPDPTDPLSEMRQLRDCLQQSPLPPMLWKRWFYKTTHEENLPPLHVEPIRLPAHLWSPSKLSVQHQIINHLINDVVLLERQPDIKRLQKELEDYEIKLIKCTRYCTDIGSDRIKLLEHDIETIRHLRVMNDSNEVVLRVGGVTSPYIFRIFVSALASMTNSVDIEKWFD